MKFKDSLFPDFDFKGPPKPKGFHPKKRGHAGIPGTGPKGETCKTCRHIYRNHMAKVYLKCALNRVRWTGGSASDIRARDLACEKWESNERANDE